MPPTAVIPFPKDLSKMVKRKRKSQSSFFRKQNKPQLSKLFLEDLRDQKSIDKLM